MKNLHTPKQKNLIKYGTAFRIGQHVLVCGDARDNKLIDRLLSNTKIKMICTDMPYGVKAVESKEGFSQLKVNKRILNDDITNESDYAKFTKEWMLPIVPHLSKKNAAYLFNSDRMIFAMREGMQEAGWKLAQLLIWVKNHPVIGRMDYLPAHELIAYGWHGTHEFKKSKDQSVLYCPKPNRSPLHPTQKPINLLRRIILNSTNIHDVVYDCFAGSGSTGIACEQTKRHCIMIELDKEYCQTIINRFFKLFGLKAERIKL
ncbi:MAG: site-specific DNA-methyltransferase [Methanosarcinaceae archaeon]|nr:site-specific DNA-methyltransferase [Methanosarcinaceae archaeon]